MKTVALVLGGAACCVLALFAWCLVAVNPREDEEDEMEKQIRIEIQIDALTRELNELRGLFALTTTVEAARDAGTVEPETLRTALDHLETLRSRAASDLEAEIDVLAGACGYARDEEAA